MLSEGDDSVTVESIVSLIVWGGIIWVALIWWFYRPGRRLHRAMVKTHPDLQVVPIYSSDDLISAMHELKGVRLASSALPSGAYMVFIDAGRQFGLWRIRHGRAERVIRLRWSAVDSIEVGTISHLAIEDRAVVLNVKSGEQMVRIPISPQQRRLLRITPVDDGVFDEMLALFQQRVAASRSDGDGQRRTAAAGPSQPMA